MITRKKLARRTFLRGAGASIALPFFDAMAPALAASRIPGGAPVRMGFVYVPNGIDMRNWTPDYEGQLGELPRILKPRDAEFDPRVREFWIRETGVHVAEDLEGGGAGEKARP